MSFIPVLLMPLSRESLLLAAGVSLFKIVHDFYIGFKLRAAVNPFLYLLSPVKDLIVGFIWLVPIFSNTVTWRGNRYVIGKDSVLSPAPEKDLRSFSHRAAELMNIKRAFRLLKSPAD